MAPFALLLKALRLRNGMSQSELALATGYEQAHMSSLELGTKNPTEEFLVRLARKFEFSEAEHEEMMAEVAASKNRFALSPDVSTEKFRFCAELWEKMDRMQPATVAAMHSLLKLEDQLAVRVRHQPDRLRRKQPKGAQM
jgi:transcriptional regulator with XRE-family HTH domain